MRRFFRLADIVLIRGFALTLVFLFGMLVSGQIEYRLLAIAHAAGNAEEKVAWRTFISPSGEEVVVRLEAITTYYRDPDHVGCVLLKLGSNLQSVRGTLVHIRDVLSEGKGRV